MTNLDDIYKCIGEYKNPIRIGERALDLITKDLYINNPKECSDLIISLYLGTINREDRTLRMSIMYKWLEFTNVTDENALHSLKATPIKDLLSKDCEVGLKIQILDTWTKFSPRTNIIATLDSISSYLNHKISYLEDINRYTTPENKILELYLPDARTQLNLINTYVLPDIDYLKNKGSVLNSLDTIIYRLDLSEVPDTEGIKLLTLSPYLGTTSITKISKYYLPDTYLSLLSTAEALGVVENTDYWVQCLPSQQNNTNTESNIEHIVYA